MRRAPLGKQWRDFEVLYALFLRQRHPLRQAAEIEAIPLRRTRHPHQLHRGTFAADGGIQRRRKQRRQQHINPGMHRAAHKVAQCAPVIRAEHRQTVVIRQAVGVQPLGVQQRLRRQRRRHQMQRQPGLGQRLAALGIQQPQGQRKVAGQLRVGRWRQGQPQAAIIAAGGEKRRCGSGISGSGNKPGSVVR